MINGKNLPIYNCIKKVRALKIKKIEYSSDNSAVITPCDTNFEKFILSGDIFARYKPKAEDYYVVYDDGYASFSPCEAFESGYVSSCG